MTFNDVVFYAKFRHPWSLEVGCDFARKSVDLIAGNGLLFPFHFFPCNNVFHVVSLWQDVQSVVDLVVAHRNPRFSVETWQ